MDDKVFTGGFIGDDVKPVSLSGLIADNARLRALIKQAEMTSDSDYGASSCPWCEMHLVSGATDDPPLHTDDCPAFTPTGEVK